MTMTICMVLMMCTRIFLGVEVFFYKISISLLNRLSAQPTDCLLGSWLLFQKLFFWSFELTVSW